MPASSASTCRALVGSCRKRFRHFKHDPGDERSLGQNIVWTFWEDREGYTWIGTDSGGLDRFDSRFFVTPLINRATCRGEAARTSIVFFPSR